MIKIMIKIRKHDGMGALDGTDGLMFSKTGGSHKMKPRSLELFRQARAKLKLLDTDDAAKSKVKGQSSEVGICCKRVLDFGILFQPQLNPAFRSSLCGGSPRSARFAGQGSINNDEVIPFRSDNRRLGRAALPRRRV
jgi:hypothetical protein